jgi:hypothetical protein
MHPVYEMFTPQCSPLFSSLDMYAPCLHKRVRLCGWLDRRGVEWVKAFVG